MKFTFTLLALILSNCIVQCFGQSSFVSNGKSNQVDYSYNYPMPPEICNNGIDDDEDGYIDLFDTDCPCENGSYQAACITECEYIPQDSFTYDLELLWESEILSSTNLNFGPDIVAGDLENDGSVEILSSFYTNIDNQERIGVIVVDGNDGTTKTKFIVGEPPVLHELKPSIADINNDGFAEIFAILNDTVYCYTNDGGLLWKSEKLEHNKSGWAQFADFNNDGISEVYTDSYILNGLTGKVLIVLPETNNISYFAFTGNISIAADVLADSGLELVSQDKVYSLLLNNLTDTIGNSFITLEAPFSNEFNNKSNFSSVGDVNADGLLDIITLNGLSGDLIKVWTPQNDVEIDVVSSNSAFSRFPFIGKMNGNCSSDFGVPAFLQVSTYELENSEDIETIMTFDFGINLYNTACLFDFDLDNKHEIVIANQTRMSIIDSETGELYFNKNISTSDALQSTIVVDANLNGSANILTIGTENINYGPRLLCYANKTNPFPPARSVWNQKGYHITNVNDDLTIPQFQQSMTIDLQGTENCESEVCSRPYNSFLAQATTRTQEGCFVWNASDFSIEVLDFECVVDSLVFNLAIGNTGTIKTPQCINFSSYLNEVDSSNLIETISWCKDPEMMNSFQDTIQLKIPALSVVNGALYWTINDMGYGFSDTGYYFGSIIECDYSNNIDSISATAFAMQLDLGGNIEKCETEELLLDAGSGFLSYEWQDGSTGSSFMVTEEGWYHVSVINQCDQTFTDSVFVENTEAISLDLGEDILLCPNELFVYVLPSEYDSIDIYVNDVPFCSGCTELSIPINALTSIDVFVSVGSCSAIDSLWVQPKEEIIIDEDLILCDGDFISYDDLIIDSAGDYLIPLNGCDSTLSLHVEIETLDSLYSTLVSCIGESISIEDVFYSTDTVVISKIEHVNSCDTIHVQELVFQEQGKVVSSHIICEEDSILLYGNWYKDEGFYESFIEMQNACDSILEITIEHYEVEESMENYEICSSDSVLINNQWISSDTTIMEYFSSVDGCDSLHIKTVSLISRTSAVDSLYICSNDSVLVEGSYYSEEGLYEEIYSDGGICDSIYQFYVVERMELLRPSVSLNCEEKEYSVSFEDAEGWMIEWSNGLEGSEIGSLGNEDLVATAVSIDGCELSFDVDVPEIPSINQIGIPLEIELEANEAHELALDIDTSSWDISWSPSSLVDCIDCSKVNILTSENGILNVVFTHESGCTESYTIFLVIKEPTIYLPTIFTPNNDGINDTWEAFHSDESIISLKCSIYDRWGSRVYKNVEGEDVRWDGTLNGQGVQAGVYMYVLEVERIGGGVESKVGSIMVSR